MNIVDVIILVSVGLIVTGIIYRLIKSKDETECQKCAYAKRK